EGRCGPWGRTDSENCTRWTDPHTRETGYREGLHLEGPFASQDRVLMYPARASPAPLVPHPPDGSLVEAIKCNNIEPRRDMSWPLFMATPKMNWLSVECRLMSASCVLLGWHR